MKENDVRYELYNQEPVRAVYAPDAFANPEKYVMGSFNHMT